LPLNQQYLPLNQWYLPLNQWYLPLNQWYIVLAKWWCNLFCSIKEMSWSYENVHLVCKVSSESTKYWPP
jgi:hypothetical protein